MHNKISSGINSINYMLGYNQFFAFVLIDLIVPIGTAGATVWPRTGCRKNIKSVFSGSARSLCCKSYCSAGERSPENSRSAEARVRSNIKITKNTIIPISPIMFILTVKKIIKHYLRLYHVSDVIIDKELLRVRELRLYCSYTRLS